MLDQIVASQTRFGGHMNVKCLATLQTVKCVG